jgi:hypothetical protein
MAGPRQGDRKIPGEPLETVIPPMLEVPGRREFYKRKVKMYKVGLTVTSRLPTNANPQYYADWFMKTPTYHNLIMRYARKWAGYRDDGSGRYLHLPGGYRERVQQNFYELLDAFWAGWYGYGMLDRGNRTGVSAKPE